jgi:protein-disulfide isomerase
VVHIDEPNTHPEEPMQKKKIFILLTLLFIPLFFTSCTDNERLTSIEKTQEEILAKVSAIEKNLENIFTRAQPRRPSIDPNKVHNIPTGASPIKGNKNAPVTIVEFSDFQCPYCSRLQPTLRQVLDAYPQEVRLVYKHFPLAFHKQARNAAKASMAAGEQGKFWGMHDIIFENYNTLTEEKFSEFAKQLGLDMEKFKTDYTSTKYDKQIQDEFNMGQRIGVRGTPTLFLNGKMMTRRSFNDFKQAIDEALKKKNTKG